MNSMRIRRTAGSESGGALVELVVSLPLLILILVATIDFARVFYTGIALTNAARAGAQFGAFNMGQSGNIGAMQTTAINSTNTPGVTAVASRLCQCATDTGTFSATSPPNDCVSPAATSCPGTHLVVTVTVVTSKTFNTIIGGAPGVPSSISLSRTATLRVPN